MTVVIRAYNLSSSQGSTRKPKNPNIQRTKKLTRDSELGNPKPKKPLS
jgi:hypothetical protein